MPMLNQDAARAVPMLAASWFLCSALSAPMPCCRSCTLHFCTHFCATEELQALGCGFLPLLPWQHLHFQPTELNPFAGWEEALKIFQKSSRG